MAQSAQKKTFAASEGRGNSVGKWLRGVDLNHRPLGYEPNELPDCSTPRFDDNNRFSHARQTCAPRNACTESKSQTS